MAHRTRPPPPPLLSPLPLVLVVVVMVPLIVVVTPCQAVPSPGRSEGAPRRVGSTGCGATHLVQRGQPVVITSPGYPADHARRQRCSWRLQPSHPDDVITLVCTDVDLAGFRLGVRVGDFLRVRAGGRSVLIQHRDLLHCGDVPLKIQGEAGEPIHVRFSSDGMFERRGFSCQASVPPDPTDLRASRCTECGVTFASEADGNVTQSATPAPDSPLRPSAAATDDGESSSTVATTPALDRPGRPAAPLSTPTASTLPASTPTSTQPMSTPTRPAAVHLSTWYNVIDVFPGTGPRPRYDTDSSEQRNTQAEAETASAAEKEFEPRTYGENGPGAEPATPATEQGEDGKAELAVEPRATDWQNVEPPVPLRHRGRVGRQERRQDEPPRLPARSADLRVAGGEEAAPGAYPWAVFLVLTVEGNSDFICGATVVSRRYLVTAAHCVHRADAATVLLGFHSLREPGPHSVQVPAAEAVVHPEWSERFVKHDIALLRLHHSIEYNAGVRPICLPTREQVADTFAGELATVLGWGGVGRGSSEGRLRAAQVPLIANCRCQLLWPAVVTPLKLCASGRDGTSACGGDSGGALQLISGDGHAVLVGVVSWGSGLGCDRGLPSGYTRVTPYLDWIEQQSDVTVRPY